jgi:flagellar biosynthetic protein FliQ
MSEADAAGALREALWLLVKLGGPLLVAALVVGLVVSLVQAVTQINEPTLVFLPKLLVLGAAMALLGPFMTEQLNGFAHGLMDRLVSVGGR